MPTGSSVLLRSRRAAHVWRTRQLEAFSSWSLPVVWRPSVQSVRMTTTLDYANAAAPSLPCPLRGSGLYPSLVLAMRDFRTANARDPETGAGVGNHSWIALALGMIVLDTLSGSNQDVGTRWKTLLTTHGISDEDALLIYKLRCSVLHGYGLPRPADTGGRSVVLSGRTTGYALDTTQPGHVDVSVPLFCSLLVERIANEAPDDWDVGEILVSPKDY